MRESKGVIISGCVNPHPLCLFKQARDATLLFSGVVQMRK